jgi:hypothetical protein
MQDADLFMELAGIVGVFVGFGALIAVRSGGPSEPGALVLAPIVIVLGVAPDIEAALHFTVLMLILLLAAWALMTLVFAQRSPAST